MTLPSRITDADLAHLPLDASLDALLAELRHEVDAEQLHDRRRWPLVVAAAAAVAVAVVGVPLLAVRGSESTLPVSDPVPSSPTSAADPVPTDPTQPADLPVDPVLDTWQGRNRYVVLDASPWAPTRVDSTPPAGVGLTYTNGGAEFSIQWEAERYYRSRLAEAKGESDGSVQMLGENATYVVYESQQQFAFLPIRDGYGFYVNASFTSEAEFAYLVASLKYVGTAAFDAEMPAHTVGPDRERAYATSLLEGASLPPGWRTEVGGWNSETGVAAGMIPSLTCAWGHTFVDARAAGDDVRVQQVLQTLEGSRRWRLVREADLGDPFRSTVTLGRQDKPDFLVLDSACPGEPMSEEMRAYLQDTYPDLNLPGLPDLPTGSALSD